MKSTEETVKLTEVRGKIESMSTLAITEVIVRFLGDVHDGIRQVIADIDEGLDL